MTSAHGSSTRNLVPEAACLSRTEGQPAVPRGPCEVGGPAAEDEGLGVGGRGPAVSVELGTTAAQ